MTPADLQGLWRRRWLRADGTEDATTRVFWAQAGEVFADIRIPAARPDLSEARCLADLETADLLALTRAEGFAGTINLEGDICTWTREIDWHGPSETVDAGRLSYRDGDLHEAGVHADYAELWTRRGQSATAIRVAPYGRTGIYVFSDVWFLLALDASQAARDKAVLEAMQRGERPPEISAYFASEYTFGLWSRDGRDGIATLSTNPFRERTPVLRRTPGEAPMLISEGFDGARVVTPLGLIGG